MGRSFSTQGESGAEASDILYGRLAATANSVFSSLDDDLFTAEFLGLGSHFCSGKWHGTNSWVAYVDELPESWMAGLKYAPASKPGNLAIERLIQRYRDGEANWNLKAVELELEGSGNDPNCLSRLTQHIGGMSFVSHYKTLYFDALDQLLLAQEEDLEERRWMLCPDSEALLYIAGNRLAPWAAIWPEDPKRL